MYTYDDLLLFAKIIDVGSFAGTAQMLRITQSTVSRRIKVLEESLGIKLFQYEGRKAVPTADGILIYNKLYDKKKAFDDIAIFMDALVNNKQETKGELNVIFPSGFSYLLITPYIMMFSRRYPGIILNIIFLDSITDLDMVKEDIDLAVLNHMPNKPYQNSYKVTSLLTPEIGFYCTQGYKDKYGVPTEPSELVNHQILGYVRINKTRTDTLQLKNQATGESVIINISSNIYMNGNINGVLIAYSDEIIVGINNYRKDHNLIRVLPDYTVNDATDPLNALYMVRHPYKDSLANSLFVDFIKHVYKFYRDGVQDVKGELEKYFQQHS